MNIIKKLVVVILLALFSAIVCLPETSYAAGGAYVSETQVDVAVGDTVNIAVGADNAAGSFSVSSSGCVMANGSDFLDNDFKTVSIYGASEGYGEVYITLDDFATYDEEDQSGYVITVYVNVYAPDGGYTGDYGKGGEVADYSYDDVTQVSDNLNLWLNEEPYSVLTDLSLVEKPKGFTEADGTFEGEKVKTLNYGNEIVLYALWNHWTGEVILRTYDPATKTFGEPANYKQGNRTYYLLKIPNGTELPEGYKKTELTLNDNKVEALVSEKKEYEDFYYIYAMTDGQRSFYSYDKKEGTFQRTVELKPVQEEEPEPEKMEVKKTSFFSTKIFLIALGVAVVIIIILIILLAVTRKKYKDLTEDDY